MPIKSQKPEAQSFSLLCDCLQNDGIILYLTTVGYAFLYSTEKSLQKVYALKGRPLTKACGMLSNPVLFRQHTISPHHEAIISLNCSISVIALHKFGMPLMEALPPLARPNGTVASFLNLSPQLNELAGYAAKQKLPIMITSGNRSGTGNCWDWEELPADIQQAVQFNIRSEEYIAFEKPENEDPLTTTMVDLVHQQIARPGQKYLYIKKQLRQKGILKTKYIPDLKQV